MNVTDLREQIAIELKAMEATLAEIASLCRDIGDRGPSTREVAAAGLFLANFYNGIENILKRLCVFHGASLPSGDTWQTDLLNGFCDPPRAGLPCLLDAPLKAALAAYRRFRHVVHHGYGFQLDWEQMRPGLQAAGDAFRRFRQVVEEHLGSLGKA